MEHPPHQRPPVYNLGYRIKLLSQSLNRRLQDKLEPFGLTPFHWEVLDCLWQEDGIPISALTKKLQQLGGTLTGVLDGMEKRGLLYRERDKDDRRIYRIWLTDTGKQLKDVVSPIVLKLKEETFECFSEQEFLMFSNFIDRLIAHTSEHQPD
jgi:DNA-binding MarR family transcriptional regulator